MQRLTFKNQIILGIIGVGLGHVLSWVTGNRVFENIGWIFYGFLFIIHPVCPKQAKHNPRMATYIRLTGVLIALIGCFIRTGSGGDFWQSRITASLGVDVSRGTVVESFDDHSGFHGDGTMYAVLAFEDDDLEKLIAAPGGWHALPLTEELQTLIYGSWTQTETIGPFIGVTVPQVENGYWFFYDRQGDTYDDAEVLERGSFNYTIAIYDADSDQLFYCEYDT